MQQLAVANIETSRLRALIAANHYSGTCSAVTVGYGVWWRGRLSGGIVFSAGVGRSANAYCRPCKPTEVIELTRLWLADDVPANAESRVIGVALRALRRGRGRFRACLSYADECAGHTGTIYQATNWYYLGPSISEESNVKIGDLIVNSRSLNSRYGTRSIARVRQILKRDDIDYVRSKKRKHVYVYPLDDGVRPWLEAHAKPYPSRRKQATAGHPSASGGATPTPALQHLPEGAVQP